MRISFFFSQKIADYIRVLVIFELIGYIELSYFVETSVGIFIRQVLTNRTGNEEDEELFLHAA